MPPDCRLDPVSPKRPPSGGPEESAADRVGLCAGCRHARVMGNHRGNDFWRCGLSDADPRFDRYPAIPVHRCAGFSAGTVGGDAGA
jgi:hypothetical protein